MCRNSRRESTMNGRSEMFVRSTVTGANHPSLSTSGLNTSTSTRSGRPRCRNFQAPNTMRASASELRSWRNSRVALEKKTSANATTISASSGETCRTSCRQAASMVGESCRSRRTVAGEMSLMGRSGWACARWRRDDRGSERSPRLRPTKIETATGPFKKQVRVSKLSTLVRPSSPGPRPPAVSSFGAPSTR